jgi:hypothetical protein
MARRSQIDRLLAEQLSRGLTLKAAAEAAGCSEKTAKRRWAEPGFRKLVIALQDDARRQREGIVYASWHLGIQLLPTALHALQDTLQDPNASHLDKSRAARLLIRTYGPRAEPAPPAVLSVEDEQVSEQMAATVRRLLARANVVDLDTRRPAPVYRPDPGPPLPAGSPTMPRQAQGPVADEPLDDDLDDLDDPVAVGDGGAKVGRESGTTGPPATLGPPAPDPAAEAKAAEQLRKQALQYLQQHPRRPPAGPDLVTWLEAREVAGLALPADWQPPPPRRPPRRRPTAS